MAWSRAKVTTHDFALAREKDEVPGRAVSAGGGGVEQETFNT